MHKIDVVEWEAMSQTTQQASGPFYIGIDFHKHYSVFCVIDERNTILERGRIEHKIPIGFELLIKRYPRCRVVFETTMVVVDDAVVFQGDWIGQALGEGGGGHEAEEKTGAHGRTGAPMHSVTTAISRSGTFIGRVGSIRRIATALLVLTGEFFGGFFGGWFRRFGRDFGFVIRHDGALVFAFS